MTDLKVVRCLCCLLLAVPPIVRGQVGSNARQIRNITAFTRLFGYVRYFHPSDETQRIDWESFAIYGSRSVLDAPDDRQLLHRLTDLFQPIAPSVQVFSAKDNKQFSLSAITPQQPKDYKEISWQYSGMSMRFVKDYARPKDVTVRLNRSSWQLIPEHYDTTGYAMVYQALPSMYKGGKFLLKASMRVISADGATGSLGLTNATAKGTGSNYSDTVEVGKDTAWKEITLRGKIDSTSQIVYISVMLRKKGRLQVKDLHLSVIKDDHESDVPVSNSDFSQAGRSGVPTDWTPQSGNNYIYTTKDLMLEIGYIDSLSLSRRPDPPIFDYRTTIGDYTRKQLVPGISCIVPLVVYGNDSFTYPVADTNRFNQLQGQLLKEKSGKWTADRSDVRLGDIVIAWNIYRHFFPFWKEAAETPEQILQNAIMRALKDKTPKDFFLSLQLMTAPLNDGHIFPSYDRDSSMFAMAPIYFTAAEAKIVIKDVLDKAYRQRIQPGDIVDSINGKTAWDALKETERYMSGSPQGKQYWRLLYLNFGFVYTTLHMTLQRGTDKFPVAVPLTYWSDWHSMIQPRPESGSEVADKIYYVNLLESEEKVNHQLEKLANAKAIIFDIRGYPSFDLFEVVLSHLTSGPIRNPDVLYDPQIVYPDFEKVKFTLSDLSVTPKAPQLKGKIYFLSNAEIGSHPEYFLAVVKAFKLGTIVGQATDGVDGTINGFYLPGGYSLTFTGLKVAPIAGNTSRLQGVTPDMPVEPSLLGIAAGKDETLEQAINMAKKDVNLFTGNQ